MSRENVEVVRSGLAAWQRDDLEAFLDVCDPAVEWHAAFERVISGSEHHYRGVEGVRQFWAAYRTDLENFEVEAHEIRDAGGDRVLLLGELRWRGPASGIEMESPLGMVFTVRSGKVVKSVDYLTHEEALEAVGLRG